MQIFPNIYKQIKRNPYISITLLVAAIFLLSGSLHDYPYIMHPDEGTTVKTALAQRFKFGVDRFDWGHLGFYIQYFIFEIFIKARGVFELVGISDFLRSKVNILYQDPYIFYLLARISTEIMGVFTVFFVYKICRLFFDKKTSTIATLFLVIAPFFLWLSHYAVQDPPQLFFLSISLYLFLKKPFFKSYKNLLLSSFFLACSAGYKFNVIFFIPFFYLANFFLEPVNKDSIKKFFSLQNIKMILMWAFVFVITFLAIHYTIFRKWNVFWSYKPSYGFLWQMNVNSASIANYNLKTFLSLFFRDINQTFSITAGVIVTIATLYDLFVISKNIISKKFSKADLILGILIVSEIIIAAIMFKSARYRVHYLFPIYPILILTVAYFIENFSLLKKTKYLYLIFLIYPLYLSTIQAIELSRQSTTSIVIQEILSKKGNNNYYYDSRDINDAKLYNYIEDLHNIYPENILKNTGDILVSNRVIQNETYELLKTQNNFLRAGQKYYFYRRK